MLHSLCSFGKVLERNVLFVDANFRIKRGSKASADRVSHPCRKDWVSDPSPGQTYATQSTHSPTENQCNKDNCEMYEMSKIMLWLLRRISWCIRMLCFITRENTYRTNPSETHTFNTQQIGIWELKVSSLRWKKAKLLLSEEKKLAAPTKACLKRLLWV